VRGEIWGNLYLTEKAGREEFDAVDEEAVVILAAWAAIAIENVRLYEAVAARRDELERSSRRIEAAQTIAVAVGAEMELEHVLELIAKRGRALVEARSLVILLREGPDLVVTANAGVTERAVGARVPIDGSTTGQVLQSRKVRRIADVGSQLRISATQLGIADAQTAGDREPAGDHHRPAARSSRRARPAPGHRGSRRADLCGPRADHRLHGRSRG